MSYANTFARKEIKYLLSAAEAQALQDTMVDYMTQDQYGLSTIHNLYCDNDEFLQLRRSIEQPIYKEKVRLRRYGTGSDTFLELKKKYKGIVYKRRVQMSQNLAETYLRHHIYPFQLDCQQLRELDYTIRFWELSPKIYLAYDRTAYFGKDDMEFRMTLDQNIRYRTEALSFDSDAPCLPLLEQGQKLLEVKANGAFPGWLIRFLSQNKIYPVTFSKVGRVYKKLITDKECEQQCLKVLSKKVS